jgi:Chaperone of endosialidase/Bacterial SH3 domain
MRTLMALMIVTAMIAADAETVAPVDSVESYVNVREAPHATAAVVGRLHRDESLPLVATADGWYEVQLPDGKRGFVSADWSRVSAAPQVAEEADATEPEAVSEPESNPEPDLDSKPESVPEPEAATVSEPIPEPEAATTEPEFAAAMEGDTDFLVKFKEPTTGTKSQIFDNGNQVGIGTTTPAQRLEVNGSIRINDRNSGVAGLLITQSSGETGYIMHNRASTLTIGAGSIDRLTIDRDGNVGIAVSHPSHPLEMASGAYVSAGGVWTNSSSRDNKENISELSIEDALTTLAGLRPVRFNYRNDPSELHVGFIAEEVPDLVATADRRGLSAMDIAAVLTRVIQIQQHRIEELEARIARDEARSRSR